MNHKSDSMWQNTRRKIRNRFISGILVLVPISVTILVIRWILGWMAGFLQPGLEKLALRLAAALRMDGIHPEVLRLIVTIVSIAGFLVVIYLAGTLAQAVIGRRLIKLTETLLMKVPLASTIYSAAKGVMEAIAIPNRTALRTVVLIEFPRPGVWSIGFMTGRVLHADQQQMLKVFVPTTPNPTTGFFVMAPARDVIQTKITVEDAFKTIISGGIVSPEELENKLAIVASSASKC
ncbi:MAG: DUF502 domain-containing protein [Sedimentisphaerales bacterium]|nr:DUF502 domain-containing protein [Sedimentisphaerales bacterium]